MGVTFELFLNLKRKTMHTAPHICMACSNPNTAASRQRDPDRSAFNVVAISAAEASALIDTLAPFISIQIDALSPDDRVEEEPSVIRTGEKPDGSAFARSSRRHL
jgi:hypothetical protein